LHCQEQTFINMHIKPADRGKYMSRKKEIHVELRYYEVPQNEYALTVSF